MTIATSIPDEKVEELAETLPDLEKAMGYSLADAIREGSSVTQQCIGGWTDDNGEEMCASTRGEPISSERSSPSMRSDFASF